MGEILIKDLKMRIILSGNSLLYSYSNIFFVCNHGLLCEKNVEALIAKILMQRHEKD